MLASSASFPDANLCGRGATMWNSEPFPEIPAESTLEHICSTEKSYESSIYRSKLCKIVKTGPVDGQNPARDSYEPLQKMELLWDKPNHLSWDFAHLPTGDWLAHPQYGDWDSPDQPWWFFWVWHGKWFKNGASLDPQKARYFLDFTFNS